MKSIAVIMKLVVGVYTNNEINNTGDIIMPIPNHCFECDKPITASDGWYCEICKPEYEEE